MKRNHWGRRGGWKRGAKEGPNAWKKVKEMRERSDYGREGQTDEGQVGSIMRMEREIRQ